MSKKRSPFKGFTVEQIEKVEACSFVIVLGNNFYDKDGNFVFSKQQAEKNYNKILSKMVEAIHYGNEKEKSNALKCMAKFKILPLRVH